MTVSSLSRSQAAPAAVGRSFLQMLASRVHELRGRRKSRRAVQELHALSGHTLKDIGLHRSEVTSVVFTDSKERRRRHAGH
jgi:uncharacterized protein YjiS (DUF1127 family)